MVKKSHNQQKKPVLPFVSICTPTFNRRPFIQSMFECFKNQDYPKSRIEWIIVDDGTDKIRDLIATSNIPQIRYFEVEHKMTLGAKRNYMHTHAKGSIIVYMDDDDYYPPERISHAVERLTENPKAMCAGASELYIYFKHIKTMYQCGPYGPNHATAGTFAFRRTLLDETTYEDGASLAEEKAFLKNYTVPFVQLDPLKTILVFSHEHNTFDKRRLLDNPHPQFFKPSDKTVDTFIRRDSENGIKKFFMEDIEGLLAKYEPGEAKMKPDVLAQIKKIDAERAKMAQLQQQQQAAGAPAAGQIMLERPGQPPLVLSNNDIVHLVKQQQGHIEQLNKRIGELEQMLQQSQMQILGLQGASKTASKSASKSDPEVVVNL